jgi:hypothetical protein
MTKTIQFTETITKEVQLPYFTKSEHHYFMIVDEDKTLAVWLDGVQYFDFITGTEYQEITQKEFLDVFHNRMNELITLLEK